MHKKNILLINPWIHDFSAYDFWITPLGLLYIGSYLRRNGYNVEFIDCLDPLHPLMISDSQIKIPKRKTYGQGQYYQEKIPSPLPLKNILKKYKRYGIKTQYFSETIKSHKRPDFIMVTSMMTYWYPGVFEVINLLKEIMPSVPIIMGGNYVTLCPEHALKAGADFLVSGRGEDSLSNIIKDIFKDEVSFLPDCNHLDSVPYPAFDLLNKPKQLPILTSRGCPFSCTYCASRILNPDYRRRNSIEVANEIEYWHQNLGIQDFSFYDDALLINPEEMIIPLSKEIIRRKLNCRFHCPNGLHLREVTEEIAILLFQAGFRTIRFGFETSDLKRQKETGGKVKNEHLKDATFHLKKAGYKMEDIGIYLICGLPNQAAAEVEESIHFVRSCGAKPVLAEYSPIPKTALWEESIKASPYDIAGEPLYHNNSLLPCQSDSLSYSTYQQLKMLTHDK